MSRGVESDQAMTAAWRALIRGESVAPAAREALTALDEEARASLAGPLQPCGEAVLACTCQSVAGTNGRDWLLLFTGAGRGEAVHLRLPTDRYEYAFLEPGTGQWTERRRTIVADSVHLSIPAFAGAMLLWLRPVRKPPHAT